MRIALVGGGVSSLSALWALRKDLPVGSQVVIFDRNRHIGGWLKTLKTDQGVLELGPQTILDRDGKIQKLLLDLGLFEGFHSRPLKSFKRYLLKKEQFIPLDFWSLLRGRLLSFGGTRRVFQEFRVPLFEGDETVMDFFVRRFGQEFHDELISAFVRGIWGGASHHLSVSVCFPKLKKLEREYGSVLKGFLKQKKSSSQSVLLSANGGLQSFSKSWFNQIVGSLKDRSISVDWVPEVEVSDLDFHGNKWWVNRSSVPFQAVLCSVLPLEISSLAFKVKRYFPYLKKDLDAILFHDFQTLSFLGQSDFDAKGFGALCPSDPDFLGVLFGHHINPRHVTQKTDQIFKLITGGELSGFSEEDLIQRGRMWLEKKGITVKTRLIASQSFPRGIPLPGLNLDKVKNQLRLLEEHFPGLFCFGQHETKAGIPDAIQSGVQAASRFKAFLEKHPVLDHVSEPAYASI